MNEQDALEAFFAEWDRQANEYGASLTREQRDCAEEAWHAALAWLRSQGEPVAWLFDGRKPGVHRQFASVSPSDSQTWPIDDGIKWEKRPLFLALQPVIPGGWREAIESISEFGDDTLCDEALHAIHASRENTEEALRIAVRLTKEEAIEKLEKLAAAPEPSK